MSLRLPLFDDFSSEESSLHRDSFLLFHLKSLPNPFFCFVELPELGSLSSALFRFTPIGIGRFLSKSYSHVSIEEFCSSLAGEIRFFSLSLFGLYSIPSSDLSSSIPGSLISFSLSIVFGGFTGGGTELLLGVGRGRSVSSSDSSSSPSSSWVLLSSNL